MEQTEYEKLLQLKIAWQTQESRRRKAFVTRLARIVCAALMVAFIALPCASAHYNSMLKLARPRGLDSTTNADLLDALYPVGCIYQTTSADNPGDLFGGSWSAVSQGRVLVGAGGGYSAGATGGTDVETGTLSASGSAVNVGGAVAAKTGTASNVGANQTLSGSASGVGGSISVSASVALGISQMPEHNHGIPSHTHDLTHVHNYASAYRYTHRPDNFDTDNSSGQNFYQAYWRGYNANGNTTGAWSGNTGDWSGNTGATGTSTPVSLTSNGTAANLSGAASGTSALNGYGGFISVSGTASGLAGSIAVSSDNAQDKTLQPYLVVYMWRRVG